MGTTGIFTASYSGDLERFRLLCESIDRHVSGHTRHYVLVAGHDVPLFRQFQSARRIIVDEREILPAWLRAFRDPLSLFSRHVWLSLRLKPLRGWHVQQLRRIAAAGFAPEEAMFFCDSDVVFVKPFDCSTLWRNHCLRFLRRPHGLRNPELAEQRLWSRNAASALGIPGDPPSEADYIATCIAWRRDTVLAMCRHMEKVHRRHWIEAAAGARSFSECMLYGRFVDDVLGGQNHEATEEEVCRIYWRGPKLGRDGLIRFIDELAPHQVAIGIQSFTGADPAEIRAAAGLA